MVKILDVTNILRKYSYLCPTQILLVIAWSLILEIVPDWLKLSLFPHRKDQVTQLCSFLELSRPRQWMFTFSPPFTFSLSLIWALGCLTNGHPKKTDSLFTMKFDSRHPIAWKTFTGCSLLPSNEFYHYHGMFCS